jgi:beta-lactam-binding protein with PASTA domain
VATRGSSLPKRRPWQVVRFMVSLIVIVLIVFLSLRVLARYVAVSEVTLPNLVGLSSEEAEQTLEQLGLTAQVYPSIVATAAINTITAQSPQAGFVVREGRSVSLGVNTPTNVDVPSLVASTEAQARAVLQQLNLELGEITYNFSDLPERQILSQVPSEGTSVAVPSAVSIVVSRGTDVPKITMPDMRGQNIEAAKSRLRTMGLTQVDSVPSSVTNDAGQTVTQQSPMAGQTITISTRVTLGYSLSSQTIRQVPNLKGLSLASAQVALRNAGLTIGSVSYINPPDPAQGAGIVSYQPSTYTLPGAPVKLVFNGYESMPAQPLAQQLSGQTQTLPLSGQTTPQPTNQAASVVPQGPPPGAEIQRPTIPTPVNNPDGSREVPFSFDPTFIGTSQVMNQNYKLRVTVTDDQGEERELLNRTVSAGQAVTASLKVYGEATIQTYINDILYGAYNP